MANLPLESIEIIEISTSEPAAFCTCQLGDLGAKVLRIELPGQLPNYPKQVWESANRNKKSILLNPRSPDELELFKMIVRSSDVLIEDQPPGRLKKLAMDYETLKELNPSLIYCSISPYGQGGPYCELPGEEICAQAIGGMLMLKDNTLGNIGNPNIECPSVPDVMVAETKAALHATVGILSALLARNKTGQGQYLDVCLLDGIVAQKAVKPMADAQEEVTGFQIYETKDKKYVVTAAIEPWTRRNLLEKLGRSDLAEVSQDTEQKRSEAITILRNIFKSKTRKEWLDLFQDVDTELSPAYSYKEAPSDPQVSDREMLVEIVCSDATKAIQYSIPMKFSETPGQIRHPAPKIGQDTEKFMSEANIPSFHL